MTRCLVLYQTKLGTTTVAASAALSSLIALVVGLPGNQPWSRDR